MNPSISKADQAFTAASHILLKPGSRIAAGHRDWFCIGLIATDAVLVALAFGLAYALRFQGGVTLAPEVAPDGWLYWQLIAALIPLWLLLFTLLRLYSYDLLLGGTLEYAHVFYACTIGMMLVVAGSFFSADLVISRAWLLLAWMLTFLCVASGRFLMRRLAYYLRRHGWFVSRALLIGANAEAAHLAESLLNARYSGLALVGYIDAARSPLGNKDHHALTCLGDLTDLSVLVRQMGIQEVIVATTAVDRDQMLSIYQQLLPLQTVQVRLSSGIYEMLTTGMRVNTFGAVPLTSLNHVRLDPVEQALKIGLDYTLILVCSILLAPLFLILACCVKFDSAGPIFYRRRVMGVGGRSFDAYKFRTMHVDGDEILARHPDLQAQLKSAHKLKADPRVTRVGRWLRATSLDELPQLLNVLRGQMSIVGPRMISPDEMEMYGAYAWNLLTVRPGITGLWQVSGRADLTYDERVHLDMHYIRNYNVWMDIQILFVHTLPAVIGRRGAY